MWPWVSELQRLVATGEPVAVVTVIATSGSTPREVGAKMLVRPDGHVVYPPDQGSLFN